MTDKTTEELLKIVGDGRANYSEEDVQEAEEALKSRAKSQENIRKDEIRKYGRVTAFVGGAMLFAAIMAGFMNMNLPSGATQEEGASQIANFRIIFFAVGILQAISGALLVIGGLGFRKFKDWGRKCIIIVLGIALTYIIGFTVFWQIMILGMGIEPHTIMMAVMGLGISTAFFLFLLKFFRYFKSEEIVKVCRNDDESEDRNSD